MPCHEEGSPRVPSGYSIAIAALYCLSGDSGTSDQEMLLTGLLMLPMVKRVVVWDQYGILW